MLLRVTSEIDDQTPNLASITQGKDVVSGVAYGELLSELVELTLDQNHEADSLAATRQAISDAMSPEALVDAAAIIGNFQRMVRIADGTGIPLDKPMAAMTVDMREELGYNDFESAKNTPPVNPLLAWLAKTFRPLMIKGMTAQRNRG